MKPANLLVRREGERRELGGEADRLRPGDARATRRAARRRRRSDRTLDRQQHRRHASTTPPRSRWASSRACRSAPYSDVYGFGKTCCFALFGRRSRRTSTGSTIPRELADLLGRCLAEQPKGRPQDFAAVLAELDRLMKPRDVPVPQNLPEVIPVTLEAIPVEEPRVERAEPRRAARQ